MTTPKRPDSKPTDPPTPRSTRSTPAVAAPAQGTRSLVEQIVADQKRSKVEFEAAVTKRPTAKRYGAVAAVVLVIANVVAWLIVPPTSDGRGTRRSPSEIDRDLRLVIASAASDIDVWRRLHEGRLPPSLSEAGVTDSGLVFVNVDSVVYEVRGSYGDIHLAYRSNTPLTDFLDAAIPVRK